MVCIKFKDFYALEDIQKLKYNAENEKKIFVNHVSDKRAVSKIYVSLLYLVSKNNLMKDS